MKKEGEFPDQFREYKPPSRRAAAMGSCVLVWDNLASFTVARAEGLHHAWPSCRALDATASLRFPWKTTEENTRDPRRPSQPSNQAAAPPKAWRVKDVQNAHTRRNLLCMSCVT